MWELFGDADGEEGVGNVKLRLPGERESEGRIFSRDMRVAARLMSLRASDHPATEAASTPP